MDLSARIALATVLLASAAPSRAMTMVCIPEVAAVVSQLGETFESGRLNTKSKFILSDESGQLQVKLHPDNQAIFTNCSSEWFCDSGEGFAGAFMRERTNDPAKSSFTVFWMMHGDKGSYANSAKGYCTKL